MTIRVKIEDLFRLISQDANHSQQPLALWLVVFQNQVAYWEPIITLKSKIIAVTPKSNIDVTEIKKSKVLIWKSIKIQFNLRPYKIPVDANYLRGYDHLLGIKWNYFAAWTRLGKRPGKKRSQSQSRVNPDANKSVNFTQPVLYRSRIKVPIPKAARI